MAWSHWVLNMKHTLLIAGCLSALFSQAAYSDLPTLRARQQQLETSLDKVMPALVSVQDGYGAGSGVVVSADGVVLTASHVVETRFGGPKRLVVVFPDGSKYRAELLGMNRSADAAMLKISEPYRHGKDFPFVELGESKDLERGDWCFALGHPGGFRTDRPAPVRLGRILSVGHRTVVSDCAIVLGDSGGPLFDLSGRLIGIHSMITEVIVENRHVAIDVFRRDGDRMENHESWGRLNARDDDMVETEFFGVGLRWRNFTPEVIWVLRSSPAEKAGIREGDILLSIGQEAFADPLGLSSLLSDLTSDQKVDVKYDRRGRERTVSLITGQKPSNEELENRKEKGISVQDREHYRELKNQLTSLRSVGPYEKRSTEELVRFEPIVSGAVNSVVELREFGETLAMGTVMSSDGYILTKASELEDAIDPECILSNGKRLKIREVAIDRTLDLVLLKVEAGGMTPVVWSTEAPPTAGRIVITTDARGTPLLPGVISVPNRSLTTKGFLGVVLRQLNRRGPVVVQEVLPGGAAKRYGIKEGDIVLAIDGTTIHDSPTMIRLVSESPTGKSIAIRIERDRMIRTIDVELTAKFVAEDNEVMLDRYRDTENLGKYASVHNSGFPEAMQHDTDLFPDQCGGPLFDLSGNAVGLNIARAARIASYALPAHIVVKAFEDMKKQDAPKQLKRAS